MITTESLGERIVRLRTERGYDHREPFARAAGVSTLALANIEHGVTDAPTLQTLQRIAAALGTSVSELIRGIVFTEA